MEKILVTLRQPFTVNKVRFLPGKKLLFPKDLAEKFANSKPPRLEIVKEVKEEEIPEISLEQEANGTSKKSPTLEVVDPEVEPAGDSDKVFKLTEEEQLLVNIFMELDEVDEERATLMVVSGNFNSLDDVIYGAENLDDLPGVGKATIGKIVESAKALNEATGEDQ